MSLTIMLSPFILNSERLILTLKKCLLSCIVLYYNKIAITVSIHSGRVASTHGCNARGHGLAPQPR